MHYTLNQLTDIIKAPIDSNKWGSDTHQIISIIRTIQSANCSSCMLRRKTSELNALLNKYGDSVGHQIEYSVPDPSNADKRIPCPDCVAKHLATCMVLQSEFYQGYTDYLPLIEANLKEAFEECSEGNRILKLVLSNALKAVTVDNAPSIPILLCAQLNDPDTTKTEATHDDPPTITEVDLNNLIHNTPTPLLVMIKRILNGIVGYSDYNDIISRFDWAGRLNIVADIIASRHPHISRALRARRLRCYDNPSDPTINPVWISCDDIKKALEGIE